MKFGQLIEYNMRNIFLEISYTKSGGETIRRSVSKKIKLSTSVGLDRMFYTVCFYCNQVEDYRNILKLSCRLLAFTSVLFKKTKRGLELVSA